MERIVQTTLIISLVYISSITIGHAFDIDATVDDEIRKNYNSNKLIQDTKLMDVVLDKNIEQSIINKQVNEDLPSLPNILKQDSKNKNNSNTGTTTTVTKYSKYIPGNIKVRAGSSFNVVSNTSISDWQRKGTMVKFTLKTTSFGRGFSIPSGTVFMGEIIESHQPQITCNGGLVVIKIDTMIYKNQKVPVIAYVTRANDKKIFFNNIKGERKYLKTMWQKGNWGRVIFDKMAKVSIGLGADGSTIILTPFPIAYGTLCLGLNTIISPVTAFFAKGGHVSIPQGSNYRLKLVEDVYIN